MPVRPTAQADVYELWLVDLAAAADALAGVEAAIPRLSPSDETRLARVSDVAVRRERRAAHVALRILLERTFGAALRRVPYLISATGKPGLPEGGGAFSLSHVPGLALIGIARSGMIGVDVERLRTLRISGERRLRIERAAIAVAGGAPLPDAPGLRLLQAWVRIEAAAKAEGCGVGPLLTRLGVGGAASATVTAAPSPFTVHDLSPGAGLVAAAAVPSGIGTEELRMFPSERAAIERLTGASDC